MEKLLKYTYTIWKTIQKTVFKHDSENHLMKMQILHNLYTTPLHEVSRVTSMPITNIPLDYK